MASIREGSYTPLCGAWASACGVVRKTRDTLPLAGTAPFVLLPFRRPASFWTDTLTFYDGKCQRFTNVERVVQ